MKNLFIVFLFIFSLSCYSQNQDGEVIEYHPKGQIKTITNYKNGVKDGVFKRLLSNGVVIIEGSYSNGEKIGVWKNYYANEALNYENDYNTGERKSYGVSGYLASYNQYKYIHNNKVIAGGIRTEYNMAGTIIGKTEIFDLFKTYNTYHPNGDLEKKYIYATVKDTIVSIDPNDYFPKKDLKTTKRDDNKNLITLKKVFFSSGETIQMVYDENGIPKIKDYGHMKGSDLFVNGKFQEAIPHFRRSLSCGNLSSVKSYIDCISYINASILNKTKTVEKDSKEYNEIKKMFFDNLSHSLQVLEFYFFNYEDKVDKNTLEIMNILYGELNIDNDLSKKVKKLMES